MHACTHAYTSARTRAFLAQNLRLRRKFHRVSAVIASARVGTTVRASGEDDEAGG